MNEKKSTLVFKNRKVQNNGGVYKITNVRNNRFYYGSTVNFGKRWSAHKRSLEKQEHCNLYLLNDWNKSNCIFTFEPIFIVENVNDITLIRNKEQEFLDKFHGKPDCYNSSRNAGLDQELRAKYPVNQIDPVTNEIIATYPFCRVAAEAVGVTPSTIERACKGKLAVVKGFKWAYADPERAEFFTQKDVKKLKTIVVYNSQSDKIEHTFNDSTEAGKFFGIRNELVGHYCMLNRHFLEDKRKYKTYNGSLFFYEEDFDIQKIKQKFNKIKKLGEECKICHLPFQDKSKLSTHIQLFHNINTKEYTAQYILGFPRGVLPVCAVSGCNEVVRYSSYTFKTYCKNHSKLAMSKGGAIGGKLATSSIQQFNNFVSECKTQILPEKSKSLSFVLLDVEKKKEREDKNFLMTMKLDLESKGIQPYFFFSCDWKNECKKEIIKSMIRSRLGTPEIHRYGARDLKIEKIDNFKARNFFDRNHIQGNVIASVYFGLCDGDEIIQAISLKVPSFDGYRKENLIEIGRFASKINTSVAGGFSKLMNKVESWAKENNYAGIITYADRTHGTGKVYELNGFEKIGETKPNYFYTDGQKLYHRLYAKADKNKNKTEKQVADEKGVWKIYGCGNFVFKKFI